MSYDVGERKAPDPAEQSGSVLTRASAGKHGNASTLRNMSPQLLKVVQRAKNEPEGVFHSLAHHIDVPALERAYHRLRRDAAVGVDGVTKDAYGQKLEENLERLHEGLKSKRWRHQPIRRVRIPKGEGKTRPIGISATEDKIVQGAVREVIEAVYEQDFLPCSYGFRPGRRAHDALRAVDQALRRYQGGWVLEADIVSFFDSVDRKALIEMLQTRIADGSLLRLVGKCLHAGVLDGEEYFEPGEGTAQGSVLSPLLGNIYLHYVLDTWFYREVMPRLRGRADLIRYCDDFVVVFERKDDAERVREVLPKRVGRYGLTLHPDKTRLLAFGRPNAADRRGPGSFDFLGFTIYWCRTRRGGWRVAYKTRRARLGRFLAIVTDYCRSQRHRPVREQHAALTRRIEGHFNYFGVNGNVRSLAVVVHATHGIWRKWLRRRSQRTRLTWERFERLLEVYPLPRPRIRVQVWGG